MVLFMKVVWYTVVRANKNKANKGEKIDPKLELGESIHYLVGSLELTVLPRREL